MTKLLTTGEMIDELKVGRKAESVDGHVVERLSHGEIISIRDNGYHSAVVLTEPFLKTKWRILPTYVSFSEAMKAIEEGKDVHCQYNDEAITIKSYDNRIGSICFDRHCESGGGAAIKIAWIVAGKWTIEED